MLVASYIVWFFDICVYFGCTCSGCLSCVVEGRNGRDIMDCGCDVLGIRTALGD